MRGKQDQKRTCLSVERNLLEHGKESQNLSYHNFLAFLTPYKRVGDKGGGEWGMAGL